MHVQSLWKLKCKTGALSVLKYLLQLKYLLVESLRRFVHCYELDTLKRYLLEHPKSINIREFKEPHH